MKINDRDLVWFTPIWKKLYEYAKETGKPKPRKWEKKLSKLYGGKVMTYAELRQSFFAVSYTHLTLPTICSV